MIAGQLELQMFANLARLQQDMDSAKRLVGTATQQIESAAAKATAALAGLGIGIGVSQFAGMIKGAIDAADKLNDLSKSTGLAVEILSGLKLASKQSGADLEGTAASINKLSVNIGKNAEKFADLGVTAKNPLEAFKQLSDVFKNINDPQLRAAVGAEALGKSWASAAPLLMEGGAEIQKMVDKGAKLSGVTTAMAQEADALNDKWEELVGTGGLVNGITTSLLPVFNVLIEDLLGLRKGSDEAEDGFSYFAETLKAVVVLGGNVAFAIKGVGAEISGITTQINMLKIGEFGLAFSVGSKMKADAAIARTEFDTWESRVMNAGKAFANKNSALAAAAGDPNAYATSANANSKAAAEAAARARAFVTTPKAGGDDNAAFNDGINAQIETLKRFQSIKEAIAKQTVDRVTSENKRGMLTELDFINQVAAAEKYAMATAITTLDQEKILAAQKKNSKKEVAALDGQIAAAKEKLQSREMAQGYAVLELEFKIAAARQSFYNAADYANISQLDALRDKNKATREEIEAIGLTETKLFNLTLARQNDTIAAQEQKIAAMKVFGEGESAAAIQLEIDKLNELQTARNLSVQLQDKKQISLELKGFDATAAQIESLANITGKMGDGFKKATTALSGFSNAFKTLAAVEKNEKLSMEERTQAQVGGYAEMAGAAKSFFEEGSAGYEAMTIAEQAFRAIQLALSIAAMVQNATEGGAGIAQSLANAAASTIAGVAKAFEQMGVWGFIGAAAILAFMASMGSGSSGGGGGPGGTTGPGNQIGSDGRKAKNSGEEKLSYFDEAKSASAQLTDQEVFDRANAAAIDASANAVANLRIEAMKLTKGSEELELSLARARLAAGGMGKAQHELATQGMNEAELASYNYNQALRGQISVQMDIANGTELTSDNMKKLAGESRSLAIDLAMASGDIAGARAMQRDDDTAGYTSAEVAVYDHNQAVRDQIQAAQAGASAARDAAQAEEELANARYDLAGRLNVLLGRQTQLQVDRARELAQTTDEASLGMLKLIYQLEDYNTAINASYAKLERSIAAEKKLADVRLKGAADLAGVLNATRSAITPTVDRANAQSQIAMYLALAQAGGVLPSAAAIKPALDSIAKPTIQLFETFSEYAIDQARTANDILDLSEYAEKQVSIEQQTIERLDASLELAKNQLDTMRGIDTSVINVAMAVSQFEASMLALSSAQAAAPTYSYAPPIAGGGGGGGGGGYSGGAAASSTAGMDADIVAMYQAYYGRAPDQAGHDAFMQSGLLGDKLSQAILRASIADRSGADYAYAISQGYNPDDPMAKFFKSKKAASTGGAPTVDYGTFADGGDHMGGFRMVGERGPELESTGPSRITNTESLISMLRQGGGNSDALVVEIKALRAEVVGLRAEARANANHSSKTANLLDDVVNGGRTINTVSEVTA